MSPGSSTTVTPARARFDRIEAAPDPSRYARIRGGNWNRDEAGRAWPVQARRGSGSDRSGRSAGGRRGRSRNSRRPSRDGRDRRSASSCPAHHERVGREAQATNSSSGWIRAAAFRWRIRLRSRRSVMYSTGALAVDPGTGASASGSPTRYGPAHPSRNCGRGNCRRPSGPRADRVETRSQSSGNLRRHRAPAGPAPIPVARLWLERATFPPGRDPVCERDSGQADRRSLQLPPSTRGQEQRQHEAGPHPPPLSQRERGVTPPLPLGEGAWGEGA